MRATRRKAKPGEVIAFYGRLPGDSPDVIFAWGAGGATKRHSNLVSYILASKRPELAFTEEEKKKAGGRDWYLGKSGIEMLEEAGFDLSTLRFSVQMKQPDATTATPAKVAPSPKREEG
jgi:hypothetical protein